MKKWTVLYLIIISVVIGVSVSRHDDNWEERALIVSGQVVGAEQRRGSKGSTTYAEVISFELDGETYRFTRDMSSSSYPKMGRARQVIVNPANPRQARVQLAAVWESLFPSVVKNNPTMGFLWLMGGVFFGVGWFWILANYEFFRRAILVKGTVTSFSTRNGRKGRTSYIEEVTFEFDGQQHTVSAIMGKSWEPKIGTVREVGVIPEQMRFRVREGQWFPGIFLVIGLVLLVVSILV